MSTMPVRVLRDGAARGMSRMLASLEGSASDPVNAVVAGRLLLAVCGVAVLGFAPLLAPDARTWFALAIVSVCMAVLLLISFAIAWSRLPASTTLVFPALVCGALAALGLTSPGFAAPLTGTLTLCYAYIGLTQALRTGVLSLPIAGATFLCTYDGVSGAVTVRLLIALVIWGLLAQLLARLMRRQVALTALLSGEAHHDELTGIANRRDLDARMLTVAPGDTLAMCDLDHFKQINDTLGHSGGDRVLAEFGAMLRVALRSADYCAPVRRGGVPAHPAELHQQSGPLPVGAAPATMGHPATRGHVLGRCSDLHAGPVGVRDPRCGRRHALRSKGRGARPRDHRDRRRRQLRFARGVRPTVNERPRKYAYVRETQ